MLQAVHMGQDLLFPRIKDRPFTTDHPLAKRRPRVDLGFEQDRKLKHQKNTFLDVFTSLAMVRGR